MRRSATLAAAAVTGLLAAALPLTGPADAAVIFKEKFTNVGTGDPYDCDGIAAQDSFDVRGTAHAVLRGSSPFPYFREHVSGTGVTTNLDTGGTFTNVFSVSSRDHEIVDNGDGTITITVQAAGSSRFYDQFGNFVLNDPGMVRFAFDIDYNGTPSDPEDDTDVPDSFRIIRPSTGNSDFSDRDFCDDLATYTAAP